MTSFVKTVTFDREDALDRPVLGSGPGQRRGRGVHAEDIVMMQDPEGHEFCVEPGPTE
ncbi:MAG: hypothetical protein H0W27_03195 [Actinobacteria bacterium]|nr:hypothetical protein [Actinomycetota bacterium]